MMRFLLASALLLSALPAHADPDWFAPQTPFQIYGNTYYVGSHGLSSVLITSPQGHILVDATENNAKLIAGNVRALGFKVEDIKLIVNSHGHNDHAGGLAEMQTMTGAEVGAAAWAAASIQAGKSLPDDPQIGTDEKFPAVKHVRVVKDGEVLHVGPLAITMHSSIGHTPGGASWSWHACHDGSCKRVVYADSMTAISDDGYKYAAHPELIKGFEASIAMLEHAPCDILLNTHPWRSLFENAARHDPNAFINPNACKSMATDVRAGLAERLAKEKAAAK